MDLITIKLRYVNIYLFIKQKSRASHTLKSIKYKLQSKQNRNLVRSIYTNIRKLFW